MGRSRPTCTSMSSGRTRSVFDVAESATRAGASSRRYRAGSRLPADTSPIGTQPGRPMAACCTSSPSATDFAASGPSGLMPPPSIRAANRSPSNTFIGRGWPLTPRISWPCICQSDPTASSSPTENARAISGWRHSNDVEPQALEPDVALAPPRLIRQEQQKPQR